MKLRLTPRALAEAKRLKTWWRMHRPEAPDLIETELEDVLERILAAPKLGPLYEQGGFEVPIRRVLLPKARNHVYYVIQGAELVVLSVWGAPRGRGPRL